MYSVSKSFLNNQLRGVSFYQLPGTKNPTKGNWNLFGINLPDFGYTERLATKISDNRTTDLSQAVRGVNTQSASTNTQQQNQYYDTGNNDLFGPPRPTPNGGGMPSNVTSGNSGGDPYRNINDNANNANAWIDQDYNSALTMLQGAESGLRGQADTAGAQITNDAASVATTLGQEQATKEQSANTSLQTAERQSTSAMQQARDVFRQTQQQNNAQLSALGISSSSVAEALAERLGVDVARRIAGVTGSLQEVRQNTVNELGRIKNYFAEKKTQLDENVRIKKGEIQQALMAGLNQINSARSQAASDKAQARANLLSQVQNQIYQLTTQQQQFDQALQQWAAQKSAALTPIAQDPNYLNTLMATANTFNQQFAAQGFNFTPEVNVSSNGTMTGSIKSSRREDDPLADLYSQAGITQ